MDTSFEALIKIPKRNSDQVSLVPRFLICSLEALGLYLGPDRAFAWFSTISLGK